MLTIGTFQMWTMLLSLDINTLAVIRDVLRMWVEFVRESPIAHGVDVQKSGIHLLF